MNYLLKTKIYFSMLIMFFVITLVGGQYYYSEYGFSTNGITYELTKIPDSNMYENHTLTLPENSIIIRIDDVGAWHYNDFIPKLAEDITSKNFSLVIGVIPDKIQYDKQFLSYMRELIQNPNIEVAMHGYTHTPEEFKNATLEQAREWIEAGKEQIINELKVVPVTFIPPYNIYSKDTIQALEEENFKVIAGSMGQYSIKEDISILGYTTRTFDFYRNKTLSSAQIIRECKYSLKERGYCELMIHPQDLLSSDRTQIDAIKYTEFLNLLDELNKINATKTTFRENLVLK